MNAVLVATYYLSRNSLSRPRRYLIPVIMLTIDKFGRTGLHIIASNLDCLDIKPHIYNPVRGRLGQFRWDLSGEASLSLISIDSESVVALHHRSSGRATSGARWDSFPMRYDVSNMYSSLQDQSSGWAKDEPGSRKSEDPCNVYGLRHAGLI